MESKGSVIGLRVTWTCAQCRKVEVTHGIAYVASARLEPPPGWSIERLYSICADHAVKELDGTNEQS